MSKAKSRIVNVILHSSAQTGFSYVIKRPRGAVKPELMKYDPVVRRHVLFTPRRPSGGAEGDKN